MRKTSLLLTAVLLLVSRPVSAQEPKTLFRKAVDLVKGFAKPNPRLDTAYLYQVSLPWSASLENTFISTGVNLHSDMDVTGTDETSGSYKAVLDYGPQKRLYKKVGLRAAYGSLSLGYGIEVGRQSPGRNKYTSFSYTTPAYGGTIRYYDIHEYLQGRLTMEGETLPRIFDSALPGRVRDLYLDIYYCFNHKRFVYTATSFSRALQRRSAGSFVVTGKLMKGDVSMNPDDTSELTAWSNLNQVTTWQASLGGGYSFNWVLLHRDPVRPENGEGLRNLTVNVTALPRLSIYNQIRTDTIPGKAKGSVLELNGRLSPAFSARMGLGFAWDRFSLNAVAEYQRFSIRDISQQVRNDSSRTVSNLKTRASFYDYTGLLQFSVRF